MSNASVGGDGELGLPLLATWIAGIAVVSALALTLAGFCGFAGVLFLYWFSGRPSWAICVLAAALFVIVLILLNGGLANQAHDMYSLYRDAYRDGGVDKLFIQWIAFVQSRSAWLHCSPAGVAMGAALALMIESRRQSRLRKLLQSGGVPRARPPLAVLLAWWVFATPHLKRNAITLGYEPETGRRVVIPLNDTNKHVYLSGTTGSGKTNSLCCIVEAALTAMPVLYIDGKGDADLGAKLCEYAIRQGRRAYFCDFTGTYDSAVYNPLSYGDFSSLTDRLMTMAEWSEPHYKRRARGYLQTVFKALQALDINVDLIQVANYLDTGKLLALIRRKSHPDRKRFQLLADEIAEQFSAEEDVEGLRAEVRNLARSSLAHHFDTTIAAANGKQILTLQAARSEGALVYFALPALQYPELAKTIGTLITNDIKANAASVRNKVLVVFDEFQIFSSENCLHLANMGRSLGICAVFSSISPSDLKRSVSQSGDAFLSQFAASINTFVIHQLNDPDDAEYLARIGGTYDQIQLTAQMLGEQPTGAASARAVQEFKAHPSDLKRARTGEAVVLNKNRGTVVRVKARLSEILR